VQRPVENRFDIAKGRFHAVAQPLTVGAFNERHEPRIYEVKLLLTR
jgi:hypothetical protein